MNYLFRCSIALIFIFSVVSLPQESILRINTGEQLKYAMPDVNGNVLVINELTGKSTVLPAANLQDAAKNDPGLQWLDNQGSIMDMIMFPGFPVVINNIGYNTAWEGPIWCNMDADPELEIVVNLGQTTQVLNLDGSVVPGWPKTITQVPSGGPVYGDIDGDGEAEIVIGSYSGSSAGLVYAYRKNGTPVTGFPVNTGYITMSPTLADLNNDGMLEIIVGRRQYPTGQVIVLKGDGTPLAGWPQNMATVPAASAAVGDITGDNQPEIVFQALNSLYVWNASGTLLPGFPFTLPGSAIFSYSSPILVDINNDGQKEIIFGSHEGDGDLRGLVHILKNDGTIYPGWPKYTTYWVYGPPSVGYINNDNILDIAVGDQVLSGTPANFVYAWDINGNSLPGFPLGPQDAVNSHILLADIDNDGNTELIYDNNSSTGGIGKYHAINHDATVVSGWPIDVQGGTMFVTPALTDINLNNVMDMIGAGNTGFAPNVVTNVSLWNAQVPYSAQHIQLPMFQYNERRSGVYGTPAIVPVEMESFTASVSGSNVLVEWVTVTETNNSGFRLYRNNEEIAFVEGKGTSAEKHFYSFNDMNLQPGIYNYRLTQIDYNGTVSTAGSVTVEINGIPDHFSLEQNYPNPFNPVTKIRYNIPESAAGFVTIKVYDMIGNEIATLLNDYKPAGSYETEWNSLQVSSGVYLYTIKAGEYTAMKKMIVLK